MADFGVMPRRSDMDLSTDTCEKMFAFRKYKMSTFKVRTHRRLGMRILRIMTHGIEHPENKRVMVVMLPNDDDDDVFVEEVEDCLEDVDDGTSLGNSGVKGKKHIASFFDRDDVDHLIFVSTKLSPQAIDMLRLKNVENKRAPPGKHVISHSVFTYNELCIPLVTQFEDQPKVEVIDYDAEEELTSKCIRREDLLDYYDDDSLLRVHGILAGSVIRLTNRRGEVEYGMVYEAYRKSLDA